MTNRQEGHFSLSNDLLIMLNSTHTAAMKIKRQNIVRTHGYTGDPGPCRHEFTS